MSRDIAISIFRKFSTLPHRGEFDLRDLGQALDQEGDGLSEQAPQLIDGGERVLDGVVEQARGDGDLVHAHLDEDAGHLERVDQVGFSRLAQLPLVDLGRVDVGLLDEVEVGAGPVAGHLVQDVVQPQQA
jgi:hypothetical protein